MSNYESVGSVSIQDEAYSSSNSMSNSLMTNRRVHFDLFAAWINWICVSLEASETMPKAQMMVSIFAASKVDAVVSISP